MTVQSMALAFTEVTVTTNIHCGGYHTLDLYVPGMRSSLTAWRSDQPLN